MIVWLYFFQNYKFSKNKSNNFDKYILKFVKKVNETYVC